MITEFKKSLFQYVMILFALTILVFALIIPESAPAGGLTPITKLILSVFALLIAHTIAAIFATKTGNKEFQYLGRILMEECNAGRFYSMADPLYRKGSRQSNLAKYLLLGNAALAVGDFQKPLKLLESGISDSNVDWISDEMRLNMCGIFKNACIAMIEQGSPEEAIKSYSHLKKHADLIKNNARMKEQATDITRTTRDYIAVFTKPSFEDTDHLVHAFETAPTKYDKLFLAHLLQRYFSKKGDTDNHLIYQRFIHDTDNDFYFSE
ncbi:hypothetical protein J0B03_04080 [Alkalibacter rhizosphaerae]|uniref:Uncharacterized protein n=1 Tax=Alkalibacter rhizosphaerae TaxID=2815577 RepID=A0A975AJ16_9FIRM|nr:hypothetical protein [Alkalibacter rhizosphaerae]QSX09249.1 hypothetical protein J0B03_04080 [Alkalibacter rhizosphaerae]